MEISEMNTIVVFDDHCYLCSKFAIVVNWLSRGSLTIIGHYSNKGKEIREKFLDDSALEMFWLIDEKVAYGGRAALIPLISKIIIPKKEKNFQIISVNDCDTGCKNVKSVFLRSASLLSKSKKIKLK